MGQEPMSEEEKRQRLLLNYVGLLAERNAYGPGEDFEFRLWNELDKKHSDLASREERDEIKYLAGLTGHWVSFNIETGMLELIDLESWQELLDHD
jgi:hypothetical protein